MKERSIEEIKAEIESKRIADKKKLKFLTKLAISGMVTRLIIFALPLKISGFWIEILWVPLVILVFALPFYGFERLLDRIKKE